MFKWFARKSEPPALDNAIAAVLTEMAQYGPDSPEYPIQLRYLERLNSLSPEKRQKRVSPDTIALVVGNLLGILIIVAYEQKHAWVSKGMGFILKPKQDAYHSQM